MDRAPQRQRRRLFGRAALVVLALAAAGGVGRILYLEGGSRFAGARPPYLQVASPTGITVRWRTAEDEEGCVDYGLAVGALTERRCEGSAGTEHVVRLTGLRPETRYFYAVGSAQAPPGQGSAGRSFTTPPLTGDARPTRVWVLGDSGQPGALADGVRDAMLRWTAEHPRDVGPGPDVWLLLGDIAYTSGRNREYQAALFEPHADILGRVPLWPAVGNHDTRRWSYFRIFSFAEGGEAGGVPSGSPHYYAFDHGAVHFVCLDTEASDPDPAGEMARWLRRDLAACRATWLVAYFHHPPYTRGSHDSDRGGRMRTVRENIIPLLEAAGVDLVLAGHSHSYERSFLLDGHYGPSSSLERSMVRDRGDGRVAGGGPYRKPTVGLAPHEGAVYVVVGSSSKVDPGRLDHPAMVSSAAEAGSLLVDIDGSRLDACFLTHRGEVRDSFAIVKGE